MSFGSKSKKGIEMMLIVIKLAADVTATFVSSVTPARASG